MGDNAPRPGESPAQRATARPQPKRGCKATVPAGRPAKPAAIAASPDAVRAWRDRLSDREGRAISQAAAGELIGVSRVRFNQYEQGGAPLMAALAMAAVEAGLKPVGS